MSAYFQPFGAIDDTGPRLNGDWTFKGRGYDPATNLGYPDAVGRFTLVHDGEAILQNAPMVPLAGFGVLPGWMGYHALAAHLSQPGRYWWRIVVSSVAARGQRTYTGEFVL